MKVQCDYCGKELSRRPSRVKRAKRHFCNKVCYDLWRENPTITGYCDYCSKLLTRRTQEWNRSQDHFCNHICYGKWISKTLLGSNHPKWTRVEIVCAYCGESIKLHPYRTCISKRHFCNSTCYGKWQCGQNSSVWKGGHEPYYGPNWRRQRRRSRRRDSYQCIICGISEQELGRQLDVHHIIPFRKFGLENYKTANCLSNLCSSCPSCHKELEQLDPKEQIKRIFHRPR